MRKILVVCLLAAFGVVVGGGEAGAGFAEPIYMIESPTAGLLGHGEYHVQGRLAPESAILLGFRLGIRNRVHLGVSFGMQEVFSYEKISVNDQVGFQIRLRLIEEQQRPALAIGFNSQGTGPYNEEAERYERKSKGFYAVVSRNWRTPVGQLSLHGGVNYSLENGDQDSADLFGAVDLEVIPGLEFIMDLDTALNDNKDDTQYGGGGIYLDGAIRVSYGESLAMMLIFRDLTKNFRPERNIGREFEVAFVDMF
jgi:hypothetical protein